MLKSESAVRWLISQLTSTNVPYDLTHPIKIEISKEVIDEAIRMEKHQNMNEWHEGYEEGIECKMKSYEKEGSTKAVDYLVKELFMKTESTNEWILISDKNVDEVIKNARQIESWSNENAYRRGACDEMSFHSHQNRKSEKQ
jgi:hypothetical protein